MFIKVMNVKNVKSLRMLIKTINSSHLFFVFLYKIKQSADTSSPSPSTRSSSMITLSPSLSSPSSSLDRELLLEPIISSSPSSSSSKPLSSSRVSYSESSAAFSYQKNYEKKFNITFKKQSSYNN